MARKPVSMRAYLAGPMSGIPEHNFPAFREAASDLRACGWDITSPVELDEADGFNGKVVSAGTARWAEFLARDVRVVCDPTLDAVIVLPGWGDSRGARLEVFVAAELGKRILRYPDLGPARHPGSDRFHSILRDLGSLHDQKQQDYGRDDDPFANVRASSEWGIPGWVGAMIRATDKIRRLQTFARRGTLANEGVRDAFDDLAVYAVIGRVLFEENLED